MSANVEELPVIFETLRDRFPTSLGPHGWYIATSSVLVTATNPANINYLYAYLLTQPEFATPEQRRVLSRRLREQFLKQWTVIGIPRVITAVRALATIEAPEDADSSSTREGLQLTPEIRARGLALCHTIYGADRFPEIQASWGSMESDITWVAENIIYGLFLSDESVINGAETTLMSYACMASMDLSGTSRRHLVGLLHQGVSEEDCKEVIECVKLVAQWAGKDTGSWITVDNLKNEPRGREMHDQIKVGRI